MAAVLFMFLAAIIGCGERSFHQKVGWNAEDYFDDPQVIALCEAIEENDLDEIERLVANGADVNAKGRCNMTPLLWALPDEKIERFTKLLELGADPNVLLTCDIKTLGPGFSSGSSVTHIVAKKERLEFFQAVFNHGGDPNLEGKGPLMNRQTPLMIVVGEGGGRRDQKIRCLAELGADLNHVGFGGYTPAKLATLRG